MADGTGASSNRPVDQVVRAEWVVVGDPADSRVLDDGAVAIVDGRIAAAGPAGEVLEAHPGLPTTRLERHVLVPGLVNTHTHLAMNMLRGSAGDRDLAGFLAVVMPLEARSLTPDRVERATRAAAVELVRSGVTTTIDMYFDVESGLRGASSVGLRLLTGPTLIEGGPTTATWDEVVAAAGEWLDRRPASGTWRPVIGPHGTYTVTPDQLAEVAAVIDGRDCILQIHLSETEAENQTVLERFGSRPLGVLEAAGLLTRDTVLAHGVHLSADEIRRVAEVGAAVAHCPVCGSNEHPNPTRFSGKAVSKEKLDEQQKKFDTLQAELETVRQEVATQDQAVTKWQTAKEQIESQLGRRKVSLASLNQQLERVKKAREKAQAADQALATLRKDLQGIASEIKQAQTQFSTWEGKRTKARERQAQAKAVVKERKQQMPKGLQTINKIEGAIKEAERKFKSLEKAYSDAQKDHTAASKNSAACLASVNGRQDVATRAQSAVLDQQHAFETRILQAGFANARAYELARRLQSEIDTLDSEIREYAGKLEACQARVTRANQAALGLVQPDLDRLDLELQHAKDVVLETTRDERTLEIRVNQFAEWQEELSKVAKELEIQEKRFEVIGRLAEIANGTNPYRMTFQRFVLASLLDDVLQTTSHRLQIMSRNRYLLQRAQTIGDKRKAGGLDLEVLDAFTGKPRLAATLSGGEQFLASLSLALGLADVVQSWAGGVSLETLFIDEGFGSLDDELRDLALRALIDLQQGGRLVGIISHIREIREFAKARLQVIPTNRGSSVKLIVN